MCITDLALSHYFDITLYVYIFDQTTDDIQPHLLQSSAPPSSAVDIDVAV